MKPWIPPPPDQIGISFEDEDAAATEHTDRILASPSPRKKMSKSQTFACGDKGKHHGFLLCRICECCLKDKIVPAMAYSEIVAVTSEPEGTIGRVDEAIL